MNRDQLINGFMRLSTTDKTHNPVSPIYNRKRAGQKGIGRFAAQRLGRGLKIVTQTEDEEIAWHVDIDWLLFIGDQEIFNISNKIQPLKKEMGKGTKLIIHDLEEAWTIFQIQKVYRYLVDLIQPFPLSKIKKSSEIDPGFQVIINRIINGQQETIASVEKLVYEHALAEIDGTVNKSGYGSWSVKSSKLDVNETMKIGKHQDNQNIKFDFLRKIRLKAYYYIYHEELIPRTIRKSIRELSKERGGIRLYRNGFRVLPYGEKGDDWLGLDDAVSRRVFLPPGNNRHFFGFVEVIDDEGIHFEETSSREGLLDNEAVSELKDFIYRVLVAGVLRVAAERERKQRPTKSEVPEIGPEDRIKKAVKDLRDAANDIISDRDSTSEDVEAKSPGVDFRDDFQKEADTLKMSADLLENLVFEQEKAKAKLLEEMGMLRILASLGLIIGEFSHEIKHLIPSTLADANQLVKKASDSQTSKISERLINNLKHFQTYTAIFDRAVSDNIRREVAPQELGVVLRTFWNVIKPSSDRYGIELPEPEIKGYDLFTTPMHPSEWISILFNLFTNSYKAIRRERETLGSILIRAGKDGEKVFMEFCDNGDGVAPENEYRIFDAFFSTSTPTSPFSREQEEFTGTGLGLKIIKDIVESYNGEIMLVGAPRGYTTCFRIELPKATDEEI